MNATQLVTVKEFDEIELPEDFIGNQGDLQAFNEILQKDYFSVRYKKGKVIFQAGGYVGIIPVNKNLTLDIRPKVPLLNLERMLILSKHQPQNISRLERKYGIYEHSSIAINDFLENAFLKSAEEIFSNGLLKFYEKASESSAFPKGKIDFKKTIALRSKSSFPIISSAWYERHPDNPVNQLIKYVLHLLLESVSRSPDKKRRRRISFCLSHFDRVRLDHSRSFLQKNEVKDIKGIPSTKDHYRKAIVLAKTILESKGIKFSDSKGEVPLDSLILNLGEAFEKYILEVLREIESTRLELKVLDGNKGGAEGARKALLDGVQTPSFINQEIDATPDVVISKINEDGSRSNIVVEVKYKSVKSVVDRPDLNQVISYAASYDSKHALLILPSPSKDIVGLRCLGKIQGKGVFQYFINLGSPAIENEEGNLRQTIIDLMGLNNL